MSGHPLSERGITILETTVILSVLFILAGAMSPIVSESVNTARAVKAKNDASMIAMGLINLQKDVGADALNIGGAAVAGPSLRLPDLLASQGGAPETEDAPTSESDPSSAPMVPLLAAPGHSGVSLTANARGGHACRATAVARYAGRVARRPSDEQPPRVSLPSVAVNTADGMGPMSAPRSRAIPGAGSS